MRLLIIQNILIITFLFQVSTPKYSENLQRNPVYFYSKPLFINLNRFRVFSYSQTSIG